MEDGNDGIAPMGSLLDSPVTQNYIYLAALMIIVWDYIDTLSGEIKYIWSLPTNQTKFIFFYARYFGLAFQVINAVMSFLRTSTVPVPYEACRRWYIFQLSAFCAQYASSEIILSRKVFSMYERSRRVGVILGVMHAGEITIAAITSRNAVQMLTFDSVCNGVRIPIDVFVFLAGVIINQTVIWTLIFRKLWISESARKETHLQLSVRLGRVWLDGDAKWTWLLFCLTFLFFVPHAFINQHIKPYFIFSWPIALLSIGTCRLILSMEKVAHTKARLSQGGHKHPHSAQVPQKVPSAGPPPLRTSPGLDTPSLRSNPSDMVGYNDTQSEFNVASTSQSSCDSRRETVESGRSSADIEIGSLHTTSSINSEELREFYNEPWNGGPASRRSSSDSYPYNNPTHDYVNR